MIVVYRTISGAFFTILTFYSLISILECFCGALVASLSDPIRGHQLLAPADTFRAVAVYFLGYLLFLAGYYTCYNWLSRRRPSGRSQAPSRPKGVAYVLSQRQWNALLIILPVTIALGFVRVLQRIKAAGGLSTYLLSMYQFRYGIFTETAKESALVVLAGMMDKLALPLASIGLMVCLSGRVPRFKRVLLFTFMGIVITQALTSGYRSTAIFTIVALVAVYDSVRPIKLSQVVSFGAAILGLLVVVNFVHQYLYFATAGWDYQSFTETLGRLIAPQGHLSTLHRVLSAGEYRDFLYGETLLESFFFFVPRLLWESKAEAYGSKIVQIWAGLPHWYQMAPTNVGELFVHFGYVGLLGMIFHGVIHGWLETFRSRSLPMRAGYFCMVLPRLLCHFGMGISALSITLFQIGLLYMLARALRLNRVESYLGGRTTDMHRTKPVSFPLVKHAFRPAIRL